MQVSLCTFAFADLGPVRPRRSSLLFGYARIWCRGKAAYIIWCVPVCGAKGCTRFSRVVHSVPVLLWIVLL